MYHANCNNSCSCNNSSNCNRNGERIMVNQSNCSNHNVQERSRCSCANTYRPGSGCGNSGNHSCGCHNNCNCGCQRPCPPRPCPPRPCPPRPCPPRPCPPRPCPWVPRNRTCRAGSGKASFPSGLLPRKSAQPPASLRFSHPGRWRGLSPPSVPPQWPGWRR